MRGLALRPSQFVLSYGVGSIIETGDGPKIIGDFDTWGKIFVAGKRPNVETFEIFDEVASQLLNGGRIFELPTNLDLDIADSIPIFRTTLFPQWALCEEHYKLFLMGTNDSTQCPKCIHESKMNYARKQSIRFVRACQEGHLDDVDWHGVLHENDSTCNSTIYEWRTEGSSLRNVSIHCEACRKNIQLTDVYNRTKKCTGRFPERPHLRSAGCSSKAVVVLRGSSSLRIPEILTTVAIPTRSSPIHTLLIQTLIKGVILGEGDWSKEKLLSRLNYMCEESGVIPREAVETVKNTDEETILKAINDLKIRSKQKDLTPEQVRLEEFHELMTASKQGYPPDPRDSNRSFQINKHEVRDDVKFGQFKLRVAPIENLRIMLVQKGYRRLGTDPQKNKLVETFFNDGNDRWYLGMEQFGEGLFISLSDGKSIDDSSWTSFYKTNFSTSFHPQFIWWHTFSHRIISSLCIDSGYSSTSIRERIYAEIDEKTGAFSGGVLLYSTQPGGDGSMGGLTSLVPTFERVIKSALRNLDYCSNDPLCSEQIPSLTFSNGAACYACTLLSETSCELRNMYLDRNVLRRSIGS